MEVIHVGDCLDVMRTLDANSVDAIVTDPPYGLGFMGKAWDHAVPGVPFWLEMLRVAKPGAYLCAFGGTRTYHRMACVIEDAGWELRDTLMWVYGSGFPKSHNGEWGGTALKPAHEPVIMAQKPLEIGGEWVTIDSLITRLWSRLWLLLPASAAEQFSALSPRAYGVDPASAQWSAGELSNTRAALSEAMGTSQFVLAVISSLSTVLSWSASLGVASRTGNTSTTETKSSTTTDPRTLRFCLSAITPENIILAHRTGVWSPANACNAGRYFSATVATLSATRELSALGPVIAQAQAGFQGEDVTPNAEPIILARKPLIGTVEANWREHGTGALNIDGCRIGYGNDAANPATNPLHRAQGGYKHAGNDDSGSTSFAVKGQGEPSTAHEQGRWPANLIHDGSEEVLSAFPDAPGQQGDISGNEPSRPGKNTYGEYGPRKEFKARRDGEASADRRYTEEGCTNFVPLPGMRREPTSAARFFYCAKADRTDRNDGCTGMAEKPLLWSSGEANPGSFQAEGTKRAAQNNHPTVKPTDLMRWLCRLVTPPGGLILDPFTGSGSTGRGAILGGFRFVGCELSADYAAIAEARIAAAVEQRRIDTAQYSLFAVA